MAKAANGGCYGPAEIKEFEQELFYLVKWLLKIEKMV